ncbi:MAG TPA: ATP-binding cassette domain-containing protein [Blastocatellia bacterium]|nr:ATP-binding cassette domain-containing protein [Blastocatellia bacterium]
MSSAIQTYDLTRRFRQVLAVNQVSLDVPSGSIYAFLGPNGAGKTTTTRILLGLIRPDRGDVHLLGKPLRRNRIELLKKIGSLVETPSLYNHLTGRENLEVTRRLTGERKDRIDYVLEIVKLEKDASRKVGQYSLGMRQRLGLALALMTNPELMILDEPTNGLDPAGIHEVRDLIIRLPKEYGITVFVSSHLLSEVEQMATHVGIINRGKLLFQGPLSSLQLQRQESLSLGVTMPNEADKMLSRSGWVVRQKANGVLELPVSSNEQASAINHLLVKNNFDVFHLSIKRPSLEEIFLEMTQDGAA